MRGPHLVLLAIIRIDVERSQSFTPSSPNSYKIRDSLSHSRRRLSDGAICRALKQDETALDLEVIGKKAADQIGEVVDCVKIAYGPVFQSSNEIDVADIVKICDVLDNEEHSPIRTWALQTQRYQLMAQLMSQNYTSYIATASFLSPSRIPRMELPNVQDVPMSKEQKNEPELDKDGLVVDCTLDDKKFDDNLLDKLLLSLFRRLVTKNTNGVESDIKGIDGLVEQARTFLLQPNQTAEAQHTMVQTTLGDLMTPALPPFYRIFMSGIFGKNENGEPRQVGPWFYAPWLTSIVTPPFFGFLVGPSRPNRRREDGQWGGLVVEKCKFLQESGCKGLCLHQCKLPAQQFFKDELGLALSVTPNFVTQECQWSFGVEPIPVAEDPSFPTGCLQGCPSRQALAATASTADICNE